LKADAAALRERELYSTLLGWSVPSTVTIGGYGASAWAVSRYSHDIDFLIRSMYLAQAQAHLENAGLTLTKRMPVVEQNYGGSFEQWSGGVTKVTVELLVDSVQDRIFQVPLPYDLLAERAQVLPIRGVSKSTLELSVACPEALIAMKIQPMRDKDRGDICCLANTPIDEKHLKRVTAPLVAQRPELLAQRLAVIEVDLATDAAAHRLLGPRVAGPASRREPIIKSARRLTGLIRSWL